MNNCGEDIDHPIRTFIAIPLPASVKSFAVDFQSRLKTEKIKASWTPHSNFHLTLNFLGNVLPAQVKDIQEGMTASVDSFKRWCVSSRMKEPSSSGCKDLVISAGGIGFFPSDRNARIVWTGFRGQIDRIVKLQSLLTAQFEAIGFKKDKNRFFPHLTLGRIKRPLSTHKTHHLVEKYHSMLSDSFHADSIILYRSQLKPSGAIYTKLVSEKF